MSNTYTKNTRFNPADRDFGWYINGELMGFCATKLLAEAAADDYVYQMLQAEAAPVVTTEQPAVVAAPAVVTLAAIGQAVKVERAAVIEAAAALGDQAALGRAARWLNAINKAAAEVVAADWVWYGNRLSAPSRTEPGRRWRVDQGACGCPAGRQSTPCWHRALYDVLARASHQQAA